MIKTKPRRIREPLFDRIFSGINLALLLLFTLIFLLPIINVIASSLSTSRALTSYQVYLWPVGWNLDAYRRLLGISELWTGYGNSLFYTFVGTVVNLTVTVLAAYPLACKKLVGRKFFLTLFTFTMFFGGGMIPTYLVVRSLGLVNSRLALILPIAMSVSNMIIARTFFMTSIPDELREAAEIDGANEARVLVQIVLPLAKPILAVLGLYYAVSHWNSYFNALMYLTDNKKFPIQLILRDYLLNDTLLDQLLSGNVYYTSEELSEMLGNREVIKYAMIVVASVPMLLIYPFAQRYFIQGVMVGSLKG